MRVLAIDTALANCAAAVLDDASVPCQLTERGDEIGRGHAEHLMNLVSEVMADSSTAFNDLDRVIVTTGPGSFTGLRVGLSVARGFGIVLQKPVVGVTTLAAIAHAFVGQTGNGPLLVALDGKGEEVYCQLFSVEGTPLSEPEVQTISQLGHTLPREVHFAGSASQRIAEACGLGPESVLSNKGYPEVADVARLGLTIDPSSATPVPLYLRPPDAKVGTSGRILRQ